MKKLTLYIAVIFLSMGILSAQSFDRNVMPKAGPTPKVNIEKPTTFKLANGLTVMVVENHKLPKIDVSLSSDQPPLYEGNIVGVSSILADQMGNGTKNMSKDDFNKRIDFLGAVLNFGSSGARANMLSKYFGEIMGLMADAILHPTFDVGEIEKSKEQLIEGLKTQEKSAKAISDNVLPALIYGKNTARGEFATEKSIQQITTTDVEKAFQKRFNPENSYLVIVGDVTVAQVKEVLAKSLAKWQKNPNTMQAPLSVAKNLEKTAINITNVPTAVQSVIKVVNLHALQPKDKDYFAAKIANYVLGGGSLNSRLNMNLREDKAFTYGAGSGLNTGKYRKEFGAGTSVRNAVTAAAVKEIIKEMQNIPTITAEELKNAKASMKGSFIMSLERPATIAGFATSKLINDLPDNYYKNYLKNIDAVTLKDVKAAAEKYILPSKARIFIAGKATDFLPELEKLGYPISFFDKDAMPTAKPKQKKIAADITVGSVAAKYIKAIGGKAAVEKVNSITMMATAKIQGMEMQLKNIVANGAKSLTDISMAGQSMNKIVFDGSEGYMIARGQKVPIPAEMKVKMQKEYSVFPELNFATKASLKLKGIETIKDEETYAIEDGTTVYYYSKATGLKVAKIETEKANGQDVVVPTYYTDYKEVNGIKLPYKLINEMMGQEIVFNVSSYELNKATTEDFK